jgi:hypothetical protein
VSVKTVAETDRKQRALALEGQLRKRYLTFRAEGLAIGVLLREIRDDELYRDLGFDTWERYLRERVGADLGIEKSQANYLIACAQVRTKLPDELTTAVVSGENGDTKSEVPQRVLREFARLAPMTEDGQRRNYDRLDRHDVQRVAKKVVAEAEQAGTKVTSSLVRKVVDAELGTDRRPKPEPEPEPPTMVEGVYRLAKDIAYVVWKFRESAGPDEWQHLGKEEQHGALRAIWEAVDSLTDMLAQAGARPPSTKQLLEQTERATGRPRKEK